MPNLDLGFAIDLTDDEAQGLADAIGCAAHGELAQRLVPFAKAAFREYADMMLGEAPITTATDLRERRLLGLIEGALAGRIPDVNRVGRLFNIAPTAARSLLRAVTGKHRRRLAKALKAEVAAFIAGCQQQGGQRDWRVTVLNPVIVEILNDRLENAGLSKAPITKSPSALGLYIVPNGSYQWIKDNP